MNYKSETRTGPAPLEEKVTVDLKVDFMQEAGEIASGLKWMGFWIGAGIALAGAVHLCQG